MTEIGSLPTTQSIFSIHENSFYDHRQSRLDTWIVRQQLMVVVLVCPQQTSLQEKEWEKKRQDGSYSLILLWWYVSLNTFILIAACVKARERVQTREGIHLKIWASI
jgi:hypothetical protein